MVLWSYECVLKSILYSRGNFDFTLLHIEVQFTSILNVICATWKVTDSQTSIVSVYIQIFNFLHIVLSLLLTFAERDDLRMPLRKIGSALFGVRTAQNQPCFKDFIHQGNFEYSRLAGLNFERQEKNVRGTFKICLPISCHPNLAGQSL